jgi:hypothetical protein
MKKALAIIALALFVGAIGAPVIAATVNHPVQTRVLEDDKKKEETKGEKSAEGTEATKKTSDCSKSCEGEKKSDCSKSSGDK